MGLMARLFVLIVILVAIIAGILALLSKGDSKSSKSGTETTAVAQSKQETTDALKLAKQWHSNATLERVVRQYNGSLTPNPPVQPTYVFASLAEPTRTFQVTFGGQQPKTDKPTKKPFEFTMQPINLADWKISPDEALQKAEDAGGKKFHEDHKAGYKILEQLAVMPTHPLQWYFRYDTGDGSKKRLEIYINASTGKVDYQKETTTT